ncbi:MAG: trypsin-like peptidase domain-containing protein [Bdellovibrionales bacterium]|nr:trypsin-like peptidase domain-containing protein [Bdellovibrionales bacterium]
MHIQLTIFAIFSVILTSSPLVLAGSPEGMGFLSLKSSEVPDGVKQAARSTFRLVLPSGSLVTTADLFGSQSLGEIIQRIEDMDRSELAVPDKAIFLSQLKACLNHNLDPCRIFEGIEDGTGFIVGDGFQMRTAYHVISSLVEKGFGTKQKPLPIFVYGPDEELLYSPDQLVITLESMGVSGIGVNSGEASDKLKDVALLRISQKIAEPIQASVVPVDPGSTVYIAGFVIPTLDRAVYGAEDSDGTSRVISRGHRLSSTEAHDRAAARLRSYPKAAFDELLKYLVVSTADGGPRLSGAPTLNQKGEYVGVYNSGAPQSGEAEPLRFSYSVPVKYLLKK